MNVDTKLAAATFRLSAQMPYLAHGLWAMKRFPRPELGTVCVDNAWRLFYDPEVIEKWEFTEVVGVMYHELCHLLRDHHARGEQFNDPVGWNIAADLEINDLIYHDISPFGQLPSEAIFPKTFELPHMQLAEEYYRHLPKGTFNTDRTITAGQCGSCAGGLSPAVFVEETSEGGVSRLDASILRRVIASEIRDYQKSRGSVPFGLRRWADEILNPQIDWRRELAASIRAASANVKGASDYSYSRPSRRQSISKRVILPSLAAPTPQIAVVVDTSGSMSSSELSQALAEIRAILRLTSLGSLTVLSVDSAVHTTQQIFDAEKIILLGGGGTDMGAGLLAVQRLRPRPSTCIVVTDGCTPWPDRPITTMRTIVLLTDRNGVSPSWAKTIMIEESKR